MSEFDNQKATTWGVKRDHDARLWASKRYKCADCSDSGWIITDDRLPDPSKGESPVDIPIKRCHCVPKRV